MKSLLARISEVRRGAKPKAIAPLTAPASAAQEYVESALAHHRAGRLAEAESLYQEALVVDSGNFDALHMLGVVHQQTGRSTSAVELIEQAVSIESGNCVAHSNLGLAYQSLNRLDNAAASLRRAIALKPDWDGSHNSLGTVLHASGRIEDAQACFRTAVELNPENADAITNLANICSECGRDDEAMQFLYRVLELRPDGVNVLARLGSLHAARAELVEAEGCFRDALHFDHNRFDAACNLSDVLRRLGSLGEAESLARRALAIRPDDPDALNTLACVLLRTSALDEAESCCRKALSIRSDDAPTLITLGNILSARDRLVEAGASFRLAMRLSPGSASARYNLSMLRLLQGDYKEGLALYESRFDVLRQDFGYASGVRELLADNRRWHGEALGGRRLLIWAEQGFGDCLMMLRYLPMLKERGVGEVIVLCDPALERVAGSVAGMPSGISCARSVSADAFDLHCPIMSLAYLFGTTLDSIPNRVPYLVVPQTLRDEWKERLSSIAGFRVGLAWSGSKTLRDDAKRSISLATFEPVIRSAGIQVISLQKGDGAEQVGPWLGQIKDWMGDCHDFLDTAALVHNLDLVIAVDSAMAHLAGALGKRVWLLNRYRSEWRWGLESESSPWYPSMRIFRQGEAAGWDRVVAQVADELSLFQRS
jgi:tetratricopeptide (TPR) repeat protein